MSNVAIFKSGETPQYIKSVHTPDYEGDSDVIINPDISTVDGVDLKHWKRVGDNIDEMTQAEKDSLTAVELQARKDSITDLNFGELRLILTALIKVINLRLPADKKITKQELVDAIKLEIQ